MDCHAKTLSEQQRNWPIHDKELWAIVSSLTKWRSWLSGLQFDVHTDHQGLQYFQTKQKLNARQARWQQDLAEFSYTIRYRPGSTMQKADALTRKTGNAKEGTKAQFFADGTLAAEPLGVEPLDTAEIRLMQIMALEQSLERELSPERQIELAAARQHQEQKSGAWALLWYLQKALFRNSVYYTFNVFHSHA